MIGKNVKNWASVEQFRALRSLIVVVGVLLSLVAPARSLTIEKLTIGSEIELTNEKLWQSHWDGRGMTEGTLERKAQLLFVAQMRKKCQTSGCKVTEVSGKKNTAFLVTYSDGWWFKVDFDPQCVEIQWKPITTETIEKIENRIDEDIYGTGEELGLYVYEDENAHFNIGVKSAFGDDAELFLRFLVDYANHPDLALGSLGHDIDNAPPLSALKPKQREAFQSVIDDFYKGKLKTITDVAEAVVRHVYTETYTPNWGDPQHNQAMGLKYITAENMKKNGDMPFEFRAMWPQPSAEHFTIIARLVAARVDFLKTHKDPIIYLKSERTQFAPEELHARFYIYVEECGLKYNDYKILLPEEITKSPLDSLLLSKSKTKPRDLAAFVSRYEDLLPISLWVRNRLSQIKGGHSGKSEPAPLCKKIFTVIPI